MIIDKILELLKNKSITQTELAKRTGISQQNLNRLLNASDIKVSQLIEISKALGVAPTYFFDGSESITNAEIESYKNEIINLKTLVNLNKRADLERFLQTVYEILENDFKNESKEVINKVTQNLNEVVTIGDDLINNLALTIAPFSRNQIKKNIEGQINEIKQRERLNNSNESKKALK